MGYRQEEIFLLLMTLGLMVGQMTALQEYTSGCQNQTILMPLTRNVGEATITTNNCTNSVAPELKPEDPTTAQVKPLEPPMGKQPNITKVIIIKEEVLTTDIPIGADSDSRIEDGSTGSTLSDPTLEELGETSNVDSMEEDEDLGSEGTIAMQTPLPTGVPTTDPAIGNNKTMTRPNGIVMKAIPYIGLSSLAVMALMAVAAALWMNRDTNGHGDIFQMKRLKRRNVDLNGCSGSLTRDPNVTVNMLALNNNPKDPQGMTVLPKDSVLLDGLHDYSLPDVVTNEGIDSQRMSRISHGESLYMELADLQSRMGDDGIDYLGSSSMLIQNKRASRLSRGSDRKSFHIYYQPVPIMPDIQQDIQEELPNVGQIPPDPILPNPVSNIPVPNNLPPASDYYPVHIPGFQVPQATLPELDIYSDLPHASVYEVNERANRRSLMPPMDGMSSTTTSIAGGSVYTLHGHSFDGEMIRDVDAEALYEQIEDRDRRSWTSSNSGSGSGTSHSTLWTSSGSNSSHGSNHHSTFAPLLSLVPSREDLGMGPVMFANRAAHQRENYDKIDRTKRAYNKPRDREYPIMEDDYNSLVMWPRDEGY